MLRPMCYGFLKAAAAAAIVLMLLSPSSLRAQDQEALPSTFYEGKSSFENFDYQSCVEKMTAVIGELSGKFSSSAALSEEEWGFWRDALQYRAISHFYLADEDSASRDFRSLLEIAPAFEPSAELAPPLAIDLYNEVRRGLIGYLSLTTNPAGAEVKVDGLPVGATNLEARPVLAGSRTLEVILKGYIPERRDLEIGAGETVALDITLQRDTATVIIRTSPSDTEVFLEDRSLGRTSGAAEADYAADAQRLGIPLESISAEFEIDYLKPGSYVLEVRKECHAPARRRLEIPEPGDYKLPDPIILERSEGTLVLKNVPIEADVLLDGQAQNRGQATIENLCAGEYSLEVLHRVGSYRTRIAIEDDKTTEVSVKLLPTLLYAGVAFTPRMERDFDHMEEVREKTREVFSRSSGTYQVVAAAENPVPWLVAAGEAAEVDVRSTVDAFGPTTEITSEFYRLIRNKLRAERANILAFAVYQESGIGWNVRIVLFGLQGAFADSFTLDVRNPAQVDRAVERLNHEFSFQQSWLGITAVDTRKHDGTVVIAVQQGSPAADAGVEAGMIISSVDGAAVGSYREVISMIERKNPGERVSLDALRGGESSTKLITLGDSPRLLPLYSREFCYNAAIAVMAMEEAMHPGALEEQLALFNTGIALAHFNAWEDAVAYVRRVSLGSGPGIDQGTVEYFLGLCYENLGYRAEALGHYQRALAFPEATLDSNDGPLIAPIVEQKVLSLSNNP